jgi:CRP-like cAMP-binding protein
MAESRQLKAGQLLYAQGSRPDGLYLLHTGTLEILLAPDEFEGMDPTIILSRSKRVGTVKGKTVLTGFSRLFTEPRKVSLRALEPCQVVKYPLRKGGLKGIVLADISQTATLLKNIFNRINQAITDLNRTIKLYQHTARVNDNLHIVYRELSLSNAAGNLDEEATRLHETFQENG